MRYFNINFLDIFRLLDYNSNIENNLFPLLSQNHKKTGVKKPFVAKNAVARE